VTGLSEPILCPSRRYELVSAAPGRRCPECGTALVQEHIRPAVAPWRIHYGRAVLTGNAILMVAIAASGVIHLGVGGPSLPWTLSVSFALLIFPPTLIGVRILAGTIEHRLCALLVLAAFAPDLTAALTAGLMRLLT